MPRPHTGFAQSRPPAALGEGPGVGVAKKGAWSLGCSGRGRGRGRGYHAVGGVVNFVGVAVVRLWAGP